jgi:hypothetical protein
MYLRQVVRFYIILKSESKIKYIFYSILVCQIGLLISEFYGIIGYFKTKRSKKSNVKNNEAVKLKPEALNKLQAGLMRRFVFPVRRSLVLRGVGGVYF